MKSKNKIFNFIASIVFTLIVVVLVTILVALIVIYAKTNKNTMEISEFMGYKPIICISNSMEDEFKAGDIIISKKISENEINIGDIVTFRENGTVITHRVVDINYAENGNKLYVTKGDSNNVIDEYSVKYSDIEGRYCYKIPKIGIIILALQKPYWFITIFFIPMFLIVMAYKLILNRKKLKEYRKRKLLKRLQEQKLLQEKF